MPIAYEIWIWQRSARPAATSPANLAPSGSAIVDDDYIVDEETTLSANTAVKVKLTAGSGSGGTTFEVVATVVLSDGAVMKQRGWVTVEE